MATSMDNLAGAISHGASSLPPTRRTDETRKLLKDLNLIYDHYNNLDKAVMKGHDEAALLSAIQALNIWERIQPLISEKYLEAVHSSPKIGKRLNLTKAIFLDEIENFKQLKETVVNKKAIILAKCLGLSCLESADKTAEIEMACQALGIHQKDQEMFTERAKKAGQLINAGNGTDELILPGYRKIIKRLKINEDEARTKYNGKTYDEQAKELREKIEEKKARLERRLAAAREQQRALLEARNAPILVTTKPAPTAPSYYRISTESTSAPFPKIELPKLFDRIKEILDSDPELVSLSIEAINARYPDLHTYTQIAQDELGDSYTHLKPILDIHCSFIDPARTEDFAELTKVLKAVNQTHKDTHSPLTRDELLIVLDSVNKLISENYDPLFSNGIFTTDVTSGPRNTIDETVLHAYEEKLVALKGTSYGSFIQELKETNGVKNLGMGELELRRRIECKLALTSNDYHIIRAFRNLHGGHDGKPVVTSSVEAELKRNHIEFNWNEVSDLNARLETLKEYFPKLLGLKLASNHDTSNGLLSRPVKRWTSEIDSLISSLKLTLDDLAHHNLTNRKFNDLGAQQISNDAIAAHRAYNSNKIRVTICYSDGETPSSVTTEPLTRSNFIELIQGINKQKESRVKTC